MTQLPENNYKDGLDYIFSITPSVSHLASTPQPKKRLNPLEDGDDDSSPGFFGTLGDMGKGAAAGAWDAAAETGNFFVTDIPNLFRGADEQAENFFTGSKGSIDVTTTAGKITQSIGQFAAGFIGAGKFLKAAKLLQGAGKAVTIGRGMAQGAWADFTAFDAHEARLSDLIESCPSLGNPITEYLASDPQDSAFAGRFKNAIEGLGLGVVGEALIVLVKGVRASRAAKTVAEAEDAIIRSAEELESLAARSGQTPEELAHSVDAVVSGETQALDAVAGAVEQAGGKVELNVHGAPAHEVTQAVTDLAGHAVDDGTRHGLTHSRLNPKEWGTVMEKAAADPRNMPELLQGMFLTGNGRRLTFNNVEEARMAATYAEAVWHKTLIGEGIETFQKVLDSSTELIKFLDMDTLRDMAAHDRAWAKYQTARVLAYKEVAQSSLRTIMDIGNQITVHGDTPELLKNLIQYSKIFQDMSLTVKDMTTSAARVTSSGRITPRPLDAKVLLDVAKAVDGDLERVLRVVNASNAGPRPFASMGEVIINGLLSSPKTQAVNIASNALKTLLMPVEKIIGGKFIGDASLVREGMQTYAGLRLFWEDAWKAAQIAFRTGENVLDAGHRIMDTGSRSPILGTYEKIKGDILARKMGKGLTDVKELSFFEELQARAFSFFGLPSRGLQGMDEFFKQINYRADTYAKLTGEATLKFGGDAVAIQRYIADGMEAAFDSFGRGTRKNSLRYAQESTWTHSLQDGAYAGGVGLAMQKAVNSYPPLRLVMPFIRTPTNLIRDFVAHTPILNMGTKRYREAVAAGGERAAMAYGQAATGSLLWTSAIGLAMSGQVTGGYPKDPASRQAWVDAGIEPYSFKVGDVYLSFARLDPFSTFFGIAADYTEYTRNWEDSAKGNWASGAIMALASNITTKSYLTGLVDLMAALTDETTDSSRMQRFMHRSATMFIPYSSGLRFTRQLVDDPMREVRSTFDSLLNAIPGTSFLLPEKRSWITGKAVPHNTFWGDNSGDIVTNELARLGDNLSIGAPGRTLKGVDLDGEQYSRLCELQGTLTIGGLTQHERLSRLMRSSSYDRGRRRTPDMPGDLDSPRTQMVEKIISQYRRVAQRQLLREDKTLRSAADRGFKTRIAARRGNVNTVKELLTMPD